MPVRSRSGDCETVGRPSPILFFSVIRPPPISTLFPYTTLFRSLAGLGMPLLVHAELPGPIARAAPSRGSEDRKSTRLNSSHPSISYAVFCLKKKKNRGGGDRAPSSSAPGL